MAKALESAKVAIIGVKATIFVRYLRGRVRNRKNKKGKAKSEKRVSSEWVVSEQRVRSAGGSDKEKNKTQQ